jgi:hypothetical protein
LLRVGRQKYAESIVASDDYIPTAKIDRKPSIVELSFTKTLTEVAKDSDRKIPDLSIVEAERLVEELVDELDNPAFFTHNDYTSTNTNNAEEKVDSSLDSWVMESKPQDISTEEETTGLKAEIINSLEMTMERRVQPEKTKDKELLQQKQAEHSTLEIDLERHLQSINDQIVANKMKELI